MRSLLFVPGDSPKKLAKGLASAADVLIVDLEDSVAPAAKAAARAIATDFVGESGAKKPIFVRVNALDSGLIEDDLAAVMPSRLYGIMLPKAAGPAAVDQVSTMLRVHEAANGIGDGATKILPIITETAAATLLAATWRSSHPRLAGRTWGAEDLSADIGATATRDAAGQLTEPYRLARSLTLLAAAACETAAIDTVFVDFADRDGLVRECADAARDGFTAKMAIHPAQIDAINAAFTPSAVDIARAKEIVAAFAAAGGAGVVAMAGGMVDRPHLRLAERLLARAALWSQRL
ncbi:MAG: CoA ester lyase [Phyllobacteriaceae bacterium]|nr:CoA ester lyase [Phyllobacteriaceae bacterium]